MRIYSPYFDQDTPDIPIAGFIADVDDGGPNETDAIAVFKAKGKGYLVVKVSGCSCWPDRGTTDQRVCNNKTDVQRAIRDLASYHTKILPALLDKLQAASWHVTSKEKEKPCH